MIMSVSLYIVFILVNSAESDGMLHCVAFHLGLHCLPKYSFTGIQNEEFTTSQNKIN